MAHFAECRTDNNKVIRVISIDDSLCEQNGGQNSAQCETFVSTFISDCEWLKANEFGGTYPSTYWKRCSYNTRYGKHYVASDTQDFTVESSDQTKAYRLNYPADGWIYNSNVDGFVEPQPFPSWTLNSNTGMYDPPVAEPTTNDVANTIDEVTIRQWDEDNLRWTGEANSNTYIWNSTNLIWEAE